MKEVTKTVTAYVAEDGTEWETKAQALEQDRKLAAMQKEDEVDKLIIDELYGTIPPQADVNSDSKFTWYLLKNDDDRVLLENWINNNRPDGILEPASEYPAVICIEEIDGYPYCYYLSDICNEVESFMQNMQKELRCKGIPISVMDDNLKSIVDEETIDYEQLAITIIEEYDSDREESGRSEIEKGMEYVLDKYQTAHDRKIIDDMLMTFTGYSLESLKKESENR